jgi:hypothetical protein
MKNHLSKYVLALLIPNFFACPAIAFEEHGAHEHGHAALTVVQEKGALQMVFTSPAMNIVGFEHMPNNVQHKDKINKASEQLQHANFLFQINSEAKCAIKTVRINSALIDSLHHRDGHDDSKHAHHEHHHDDHHKYHEEAREHHSHGHGHQEEIHSEFEAVYDFKCKNYEALEDVVLGVWSTFPSIDELEVQVVSPSVQKLLVLNPDNANFKFR